MKGEEGDNGLVLYYFPTHVVGKKETAGRSNTSQRTKAISGATHDTIAQLVDNLGWTIQGGQSEAQVVIMIPTRVMFKMLFWILSISA